MDEPSFEWTGVISERLIREAMEAGVFENLAGKGMPLPEEVLSTPAYQRFANRILKEAKVLPEWLELEQEIRRETERAQEVRERLLNAIRTAPDSATRARHADRLRSAHRDRMGTVNTMVLKYDMNVPASVQKSFRAYRVADEMAALEREIEAALTAATTSPGASPSAGISRASGISGGNGRKRGGR